MESQRLWGVFILHKSGVTANSAVHMPVPGADGNGSLYVSRLNGTWKWEGAPSGNKNWNFV